jgi:hypothetical protein
MIKLTNFPTPEKRAAGLTLLGYWWRQSPLSTNVMYKTAGSFNELVKYWDSNYPNSIEWLGEQLETYTLDQLQAVLKDAAKNEGLEYIRPAYVSKRLVGIEGSKGFFTFASQAVGDTATEIGQDIVSLSRIGLVISLLFFGFLAWVYFMSFYKTVKK